MRAAPTLCLLSGETSAPLVQGLFLDNTGDQLIGRAENGFLWMWDLTSTLGWERTYQGSSVHGSWLERGITDSFLQVALLPRQMTADCYGRVFD